MAAMTQAAVAVEAGRIEIEEFPIPAAGHDGAVLEIESTGLCGTDLFFLHDPPSMIRFPLILGHESVGRVIDIGPGARERWKLREGERIAIEEIFPCGRCRACRYVNYHLCEAGNRRYGAIATAVAPSLWGGFSRHLYMHPDSLPYRIAEHVPDALAPLFIPLANGIRWVRQVGGLQIGQSVVIQGPGAHGLGCVVAAREAGASPIVVTGLSADHARLAVARELGAHVTIDVDAEDVHARVLESTDGRGAHLVVDVTPGAPEAFAAALELVAIGGTVVVAGVKHRPLRELAVDRIFLKEITVRGVYGRDFRAVEPAIRMLEADPARFRSMVTHSFPLERTAQALRTFAREGSHDGHPVHVCVHPQLANHQDQEAR
jgi:threonine dehydrogenase-like Zn-dependent dehydrogenase